MGHPGDSAVTPPWPDVSPNFKFNKLDAEIIGRVAKHWESPRAIRMFNNVHRPLTDYGYWYLLGTLWVSYSGFSDLNLWRRLFRSPRLNRETSLMKPGEVVAWRALPDELMVYRAHRAGETDWIAYTLIPEKAGEFAVHRGGGEVVEYSVQKKDALCLFTRRGEAEVLILDRAVAIRVRVIPVAVLGVGAPADSP